MDMFGLVCSSRDGDRAAFSRLVELKEPMVFAIVLRRLKNRTASLDVTQDVFVQVWRKLGQLRHLERFEAWLRQIAVRLAINWAMRRRREIVYDGSALASVRSRDDNPLELSIRSEDADRVRAGLDALPHSHRRILAAHYLDGCSLQEISAQYDTPVGTIKRQLHTARCRMREKLDQSGAVD